MFVNTTGDQTITVSEDALTFHIVLIGKRAGQVFDRSYKYRLRDDHKIEVFPVRDVDAVFGIGNFTWTENQGRIEQRQRGTDTVLQEFVRRAPPRAARATRRGVPSGHRPPSAAPYRAIPSGLLGIPGSAYSQVAAIRTREASNKG
ncbi:MAG: hypothetical protein EXR71_18245 [Myxococcales bacterium]|nr:hypothetical protein [Myxococcales bacterium]